MNSSFTIRYHHDIVQTPVKVNISVRQNNIILNQKTLDFRCYLSPFKICFDFDRLDPVQLVFETSYSIMQDHPFYVDRIQFDDLIDIPGFAHQGRLIDENNNQLDFGNCLYRSGKLIYQFQLPLISNCEIQ